MVRTAHTAWRSAFAARCAKLAAEQSLMKPIAIIGAGGWGTALAVTMARAARDVRLWVFEPDLALTISQTRENPIYLPGVQVQQSVTVSNSLSDVVKDK